MLMLNQNNYEIYQNLDVKNCFSKMGLDQHHEQLNEDEL